MKRAIAHLQQADPVLGAHIQRIGPFRMKYRDPDFSTLVRSIVSQQVSGAAARTVYARLEQMLEGAVEPHRILAVGLDRLRTAGLSGQKAQYLLNLAEAAGSAIDIDSLSRLPDDEVIAALTAVKGIGVWTAQMYLMFALRRRDVLPAGDLGVRAGYQRVYGTRQPPAPRALVEHGEAWRPFRSVASWYLWRAMDGPAEL
jgi:DNA-3-methyladenine glycosylase II